MEDDRNPYLASLLRRARSIGPTRSNNFTKLLEDTDQIQRQPSMKPRTKLQAFFDELQATIMENPAVNALSVLGDPSAMNKAALVYHGTGAEPFKQFSRRFQGTGEGGNAFGVGHYFTDDPGLAIDNYAAMLRKELGGGVRIKGTQDTGEEFQKRLQELVTNAEHGLSDLAPWEYTGIKTILEEVPRDFGRASLLRLPHVKAAKLRLKAEEDSAYLNSRVDPNSPVEEDRYLRPWTMQSNRYKLSSARRGQPYIDSLIPKLEEIPTTEKGGLIRATIPDEVINDNFLQWDKPLREQPKAVLEGLDQLPGWEDSMNFGQDVQDMIRWGKQGQPNYPRPKTSLLDTFNRQYGDSSLVKGSDIYRFMRPPLHSNASEALESVGILGHRFLKGGQSRDLQDFSPGNFNYVSFSDTLPQIQDYLDWPTIRRMRAQGQLQPSSFR
jgi:hypothetical protein